MAVIATLALVLPLAAQQTAAPAPAQQTAPPTAAGTPTGTEPTKKDPLRFSAFNVSMPTGMSGVTEIAIERWTTKAERASLLDLVETAKYRRGRSAKAAERAPEDQAAGGLYPDAQQHRMGSPVCGREPYG